jgi:hypothetical protein
MEHFDAVTVLSPLCGAANKWGMYISFQTYPKYPDFDELKKAIPYLDMRKHGQIFAEGCGWFLFDTEKECEEAFWSTVGDDGPTKTNPYNGPVRVYAVTCAPNGQLMNENT